MTGMKQSRAAKCHGLVQGGQAPHLLCEVANLWQIAQQNYDGRWWFVGTQSEICERTGLTLPQYKTALRLLVRKGLLLVKHRPHPYRQHILKTTWLTVSEEVIEFLSLTRSGKTLTSKVAKSSNQNDFKTAIQLDAKSTNATIDKNSEEKSSSSKENKIQSSCKGFQGKATLEKMENIWRKVYEKGDYGYVASWGTADLKHARKLYDACKCMDVWEERVTSALDNWKNFVYYYRSATNLSQAPNTPQIGFLANVALAQFMDYAAKTGSELTDDEAWAL